MIKLIRRWWKYTTARLSRGFSQRADPAVQLEQALEDAQDQHRRLKEQAANVIANQKQTEMRLNRTLEELEKVNGNARQAVTMADDATKSGNTDKASEYTSAAEAFATRMIGLEKEIEELKELHYQTTQNAEQAKAAVQQNSAALQKKLSERQKLLGQLDQAKMQEEMNTTMKSLAETVGEDVPTVEQVRERIEARYAKARGMAELGDQSVEARMIEIEQAAQNTEAHDRLDSIRAELGIGSGAKAEAEIESGETS